MWLLFVYLFILCVGRNESTARPRSLSPLGSAWQQLLVCNFILFFSISCLNKVCDSPSLAPWWLTCVKATMPVELPV